MIAITTNNSTSVNAGRRRRRTQNRGCRGHLVWLILIEITPNWRNRSSTGLETENASSTESDRRFGRAGRAGQSPPPDDRRHRCQSSRVLRLTLPRTPDMPPAATISRRRNRRRPVAWTPHGGPRHEAATRFGVVDVLEALGDVP